ncbi:MAG: hypothetical protein M3362_25945, partial [Acidobacteriota bacterium]|nr:hypothetical protein [Acidobacteriota bacterium]
NLEVIAAVREALAELSETDQIILQLRYFGMQHSFAEIGQHLGLRPDTARVRHHRAIDKVKSLLKKDTRLSRILKRAGVTA